MRQSSTIALFTIVSLCAALLALPACNMRPAGLPEQLEAAIEESERDGRVVLAYFTADWCGPCQRMKRDTWSDTRVSEWLEANAHFQTIDFDEHRSAAGSLGVRGIPTVVAFRDGTEADRLVGYRGPTDMLQWLAQFE